MESSNMKNIVVLKNIPSNMVDEAIIILKQTQKVKQKELIERRINSEYELINQKPKDYILKEAEMLVNDYVNKIEENYDKKRIEYNINCKYQRLKKYSIALTIILLFSLIINFI